MTMRPTKPDARLSATGRKNVNIGTTDANLLPGIADFMSMNDRGQTNNTDETGKLMDQMVQKHLEQATAPASKARTDKPVASASARNAAPAVTPKETKPADAPGSDLDGAIAQLLGKQEKKEWKPGESEKPATVSIPDEAVSADPASAQPLSRMAEAEAEALAEPELESDPDHPVQDAQVALSAAELDALLAGASHEDSAELASLADMAGDSADELTDHLKSAEQTVHEELNQLLGDAPLQNADDETAPIQAAESQADVLPDPQAEIDQLLAQAVTEAEPEKSAVPATSATVDPEPVVEARSADPRPEMTPEETEALVAAMTASEPAAQKTSAESTVVDTSDAASEAVVDADAEALASALIAEQHSHTAAEKPATIEETAVPSVQNDVNVPPVAMTADQVANNTDSAVTALSAQLQRAAEDTGSSADDVVAQAMADVALQNSGIASAHEPATESADLADTQSTAVSSENPVATQEAAIAEAQDEIQSSETQEQISADASAVTDVADQNIDVASAENATESSSENEISTDDVTVAEAVTDGESAAVASEGDHAVEADPADGDTTTQDSSAGDAIASAASPPESPDQELGAILQDLTAPKNDQDDSVAEPVNAAAATAQNTTEKTVKEKSVDPQEQAKTAADALNAMKASAAERESNSAAESKASAGMPKTKGASHSLIHDIFIGIAQLVDMPFSWVSDSVRQIIGISGALLLLGGVVLMVMSLLRASGHH